MDVQLLAGLGAVLAVFLWLLARQNELFRVSVRDGRALVVRGRIPPGLLIDLEDVVARPAVVRATIRASKDQGGVRLDASGVDAATLQRLRNAFSLYPPARLRTAPPIARPTLGQVLGIAWLAWRLDGRR